METKTWRQGEQALRDRPRVIAESKAAEAQRQKEAEERRKRLAAIVEWLQNNLDETVVSTGTEIRFRCDGHRYEIREVD